MTPAFETHLRDTLAEIDAAGLMKRERPIASAQRAHIQVQGRDMLNLCANNYLGLADHPNLIRAAQNALALDGYGMASVRFICGTNNVHRELEQRLAGFLEKDDAILFAACFDANGGLFEPLLGPEDAIISDALNHASIIDGIRLCKAKRYRYANSDMDDLETQLKAAREDGARHIMIATDGVFSMDGYLAKLPEITALAEKHDALVMVDDCHATGFMGPKGQGHAAPPGRFGQGRYPDRHARQGAGRCHRRLYRRAATGHRPAAPARAALPVLELTAARHRRRQHRGDPAGGRGRRLAAAAVRQREILAQGAGRPRL